MRKDWKWESWKELGYDEEIQETPETDHYNVPHRLKYGVEIYSTISSSAYLNILK